MNIHRIGSIKKELSTFGPDIITGNAEGVVFAISETTNLQKIANEIREAADNYSMKVKSIDEHRCELISNE